MHIQTSRTRCWISNFFLKKSWKIYCDAFLRFSKCERAVSDAFFASDAGMQLLS